MIDKLLKAGSLQEELFFNLKALIKPNVSISIIYDYVMDFFNLKSLEVIYNTLPVSVNINNVVYHGKPGFGFFKDGDIVTVDVCFSYNKILIDGASTFLVGEPQEDLHRLVEVNKEAVRGVLDLIDVGVSVSSVIRFLSDFVVDNGFYILPNGMGHGIGEALHQRPFISLNDFSDFNYKFKKGDLFTIEPIILLKKGEIYENIIGEGISDIDNVSSQFELMLYIEDCGSIKIINKALLN